MLQTMCASQILAIFILNLHLLVFRLASIIRFIFFRYVNYIILHVWKAIFCPLNHFFVAGM